MELYLAVLFGVVIYATLQWNETSKTKDFNWVRNMIIPSWLSILTGCALVWSREDLVTIYPITKITALLAGVSGQAVWKKIVGVFDKKIDTVVGIN